MSENFPLQTLLDLAKDRMDDAARKLGELIGAEKEDEGRLAVLQQYRAEYAERFMESARMGIGPDAWRNFRAFIGRLDDAIAQQQKIVDQARERTAASQQAWIAERNRVKAFRYPVATSPTGAGAQGGTPGTARHRRALGQAFPGSQGRGVKRDGTQFALALTTLSPRNHGHV